MSDELFQIITMIVALSGLYRGNTAHKRLDRLHKDEPWRTRYYA